METVWPFSSRLPRKDMKLVEVVKDLVRTFWNNNTRPSSNIKNVLKHCRGSMNIEPHVKHYFDMTQTQLFEMFKVSHIELRLGQRSFEKCKPLYVRINTIRNNCCCIYHIDFDLYYHTFAHIRHFLHPNHVQECSSTVLPISSRYFIHSIMCSRQDGQIHYLKQCVDGSCNNCGGLSFGLIASMEVKIKHSGMQLLRSRNISMRHISYMIGKKVGRLNW